MHFTYSWWGFFIKEKVKGKMFPKGTRGKDPEAAPRFSILNAISFFWPKLGGLERAAFTFRSAHLKMGVKHRASSEMRMKANFSSLQLRSKEHHDPHPSHGLC